MFMAVALITGVVTGVVLSLREKVRALVTQLGDLATRDSLTGALNRGGFEQRLEAELARTDRMAAPCALVVFDIDHFKRSTTPSDTTPATPPARRRGGLGAGTRRTDYAARIGGEEFAVLLPETALFDGLQFAEKLRESLRETMGDVTVSFGVTDARTAGRTVRGMQQYGYCCFNWWSCCHGWYPAIDTDGGIRDGAWVAEATTLVDLSAWPGGTRLILRKERPHPGAQLRFTDADGMRVTAFITDTPSGVVAGQLAGLELRHRQHARVEDRIRELKAAGLTNFPCRSFDSNAAWLEIVLAAADLVAWAQLIGFSDHPELTRCEIAAFRYRVLHVAARITRGARQLRLRIDATWRWATPIATAWQRIRSAFD